MAAKYITIKELSGRMLFPEILSSLREGRLHAFSDFGRVKFLSCAEECRPAAFDKWGKWTPDEEERDLHAQCVEWERFLKQAWGVPAIVPAAAIPQLGPLPATPDFLPMPIDEKTARSMGLVGAEFRALFMRLLVPLDEIEALEGASALSGREEATYLKIMRGLMLSLKIDPESRNATSRVKAALERQGVELDDETIRQRVFKIRSMKT